MFKLAVVFICAVVFVALWIGTTQFDNLPEEDDEGRRTRRGGYRG